MAVGKILTAVNPSWTETDALSAIITVWLDMLLFQIIVYLKVLNQLQVGMLFRVWSWAWTLCCNKVLKGVWTNWHCEGNTELGFKSQHCHLLNE